MSTKVRFAPSPTGPLHLGGARTALVNWLFARHTGGTVLLRIDDTDRDRSRPEHEVSILHDLNRLGLEWDQGPVRQSDRAERYREVLAELPVSRVDGAYVFNGRVIARADGSVLYHLATAVDDVEDQITHVLRGRDHISNTELQSDLIEAMGAEPPQYIHVPLLLGADGTKLSKRTSEDDGESGNAAPDISELLTAGFLPMAICNSLALSLAEFGTAEVMTTFEQMTTAFSLERLHTADSRFDSDKLRWLSGQQIRMLTDSEFKVALMAFVAEYPWLLRGAKSGAAFAALLSDTSAGDSRRSELIFEAAQTAGATLAECATVAHDLVDPPEPDAEAIAAAQATEALAAQRALAGLAGEPPRDLESAQQLFAELKQQLKANEQKLGPALRGLRAALTGRVHGPELPYVLAATGIDRWPRLDEGEK